MDHDNTIDVLNDDFATWSSGGMLEQKYFDAGKTDIDSHRLYIIENVDLGL